MVSVPDIYGAQYYSSTRMEILSSVVHFIGLSFLSYMLASKLSVTDLFSLRIIHSSLPRILVILNIIDAWAFLFSTGILVHGTGMEHSETVCLLGIINCIIFYGSSKILVYIFLVEKVHVVWSGGKSRWRSKVYLCCMAIVAVYGGVVIIIAFGRIAYFRDDGACVIGLSRYASLTLLIYDLFVNVFLTALFLWPLFDHQFSTALKRVAVRTVWAAAVALTTSCVNILVLTIMHGRQLAWVCLASCGTDVVVNAAILCWVTSSQHDHDHNTAQPRSRPTSSHNDKALTSNVLVYTAASTPTSGGSDNTSLTRTGTSSHRCSSPRAKYASGSGSSIRFSRLEYEAGRGAQDVENAPVELDSMPAHREDMQRVASCAPGPLSSARTSLIRTPFRAFSSTVKRSHPALVRHTASPHDEVQIVVTKETDVLTDDDPAPPDPKTPKGRRFRWSGGGSLSEKWLSEKRTSP